MPATLPPTTAQTPTVDAGAGTPDPLGQDDVSLDGDVAAQQKKIEDAGMNTEPGKLVKDGPIGDARSGADELGDLAKTDPQKVLADQANAIANAKGDMVALQAAAEKALADARAGAVSNMGKHNTGVKGSEEQQRAQAGERMKGVFSRTQTAVDSLLQPLSGDAVRRWDTGVARLSTEFENSLAVVKKYIDDRHSGLTGKVVAVKDFFAGLPEEVTQAYDAAEAKFADGATNLIRDISQDVNAVIDKCKELIKLARKDIDDIVKSLPASLQTWAQGEAAKLGQQLDALDKRVDQTQQGINKDLVNRANGAVQQVRERVHELREAAGNIFAKIGAAIGEFLKDPLKAIVNGLLRILGIPPESFWSLIGKLGDVVGAIAKDPVKFGKTLISGAAQGFKQFFEHFPTHLKEIVMGWLFGQLGTTGIPMPTDFSAAGIMPTVLGIVGIDTSTIMSMFGSDVSDPAEMAEVHQEMAGVMAGDPKALVALFHDHFDPASLIPMIKEAAMGFLIQALITQVAPRIAAMLVPGGAILQAVEAIFKVLMWVINNAARIFTLIESLVATAGQAVAGNTAGVAAGVESGLVQIIVLVIDFLASYIGLGGIGAKLKGVIMKVAGKLKGILKKVVDAIAKRAKAKAKAKRDQHKPADKAKPDDKAAAPHQPKPDERDPQKVRDDAKDPRNHQHDPDDKDPRNHHNDDDRDPRNHHNEDEGPNSTRRKPDSDPHSTKHKPDDDHDPKKPKDNDDPRDERAASTRLKKIGETIHFQAADDSHRVWIVVNGRATTVMVASAPMPVSQQLAQMREHRSALPRDKQATANHLLRQAEVELRQTDHEAQQALRANKSASNVEVISRERTLANTLKGLFDAYTRADGEMLHRGLQMHTHGHTLFVSVQRGKLLVELASRRALLYKLILDAMQQENEGAKRDALLKSLGHLKSVVEKLEEAVDANEHRYDQGMMPPEQIEDQTEQIVTMLVALGSVFKIDDLENLGYVSHYVERGELKMEYRGEALRTTFYGAFKVSVTRDWAQPNLRRLKAEALEKGGSASEFWCVGVPGKTKAHCASVGFAQIDHKFELSRHWNTLGHNQTQPEREAWHNDCSNLQHLCKDCNLLKGGVPTVPTVGPHFRGKNDP